MKHPFVLVDVFADRKLAGNPLAVFPRAEALPEEMLQRTAREMDHAATAFLFPPDMAGAIFRLRIFSREREIGFAGHPALGAHFVHAGLRGATPTEGSTRVAHQGSEGLVEVEILWEGGAIGMLRLKQRRAEIGRRMPPEDVARLARALGVSEQDVQSTNQPVKVCSTGLPSLIVPVSTLDALNGARPRYGDLKDLLEGLDATVVYAFTKETRDARASAHARAFDTIGASEIPGAGAAAAALSAYLVHHSAVAVRPVTELVIEQGHAAGRPSTLFIEVHVEGAEPDGERAGSAGRRETDGGTLRPQIARVYLGGRVIQVGEGFLEI
ncbi:MAG: PhzF family phenazine biosynthesis protein [Acidobacteriota bacterium]